MRAEFRSELLKQRSTRTALGLFVAMLGIVLLAVLLHSLLPVEDLARRQSQLTVFGRGEFIGALFGRYYFARKFGANWPQYRVVFFAGYGCGVGLVMMLALGIVFMSKSVFQATF